MSDEVKLSPSGLELINYGYAGWNYILDENFGVINNCLTSVQNLLDVNAASGLRNGSVLGWNATSSKWMPMNTETTTSTTTTVP